MYVVNSHPRNNYNHNHNHNPQFIYRANQCNCVAANKEAYCDNKGVGTKDGCTLMAASIEAFMESHPGSIDITGDISNAFCDVADALDEVSQPRGVNRADLR